MAGDVGGRWDERYGQEEWVFGQQPNDFLWAVAGIIPVGTIGCLGEGEGRNACHLAQMGHRVLAYDASAVGLAKARQLAEARACQLETREVDLAAASLPVAEWTAAVLIWLHLPDPLRRQVHRAACTALSPGGYFILEAYRPRQLSHATGGPSDPALLYDLATVLSDCEGMEICLAQETTRFIDEGKGHHGLSATIQVLARKPMAH